MEGRDKRAIRPPAVYEPAPDEGSGGKPRRRVNTKGVQGEQLRFCREVLREVSKKAYETFTFPFLQPVGMFVSRIYGSRGADL